MTTTNTSNTMYSPQKITLLLPMSGRLKYAGNAIRDGFFTAYYAANKKEQTSPTINVIDTSHGNIQQLYQQTITDGADLIIGPLNKIKLKQLLKQAKFPVPTIALNTIDDNYNTYSNLYQFGLSPSDAAYQIAIRAAQNNKHHALVIAPDNAWGKTIVNNFQQTWQEKQGTIVDEYFYQGRQNLARGISNLLRINRSYAREHQLRKLLSDKLRFVPERRHDFDMIFLVAEPNVARQIKPLLKFYYANNLPIYAIPDVYTGHSQPHHDKDLNGIVFPEMPWVTTDIKQLPLLNALQQQILAAWPNAYRQHPKLFALGVDAFLLAKHLNILFRQTEGGIQGATGHLYLTPQHHVYRELIWVKMVHGKPRVI